MKLLRTIFVALALLAFMIPTFAGAGEMPLPLEKKITAGTSTLNYAGQTLRITTPVALLVKCDPETPTRFKMTVVIYPGTPFPKGTNVDIVEIFWTNYSTTVYNGDVPVIEPFTGWLNTEGGFVDR
jgi:hypothetical protein